MTEGDMMVQSGGDHVVVDETTHAGRLESLINNEDSYRVS